MAKDPNWLSVYASDVYSQTGEDGVLSKVLSLLPSQDHWSVEFGAWDGERHSNTRNLIENAGYRTVYIEGDDARYCDLQSAFQGDARVVPIHRYVNFDGPDRLDCILQSQVPDLPQDFDLLSIDIDGNDYHVWEAVEAFRPKVVIIEFNPTIPTEVSFVQERALGVSQGASLKALDELARRKGYQLVSVLPWNAIFVRQELFAAFDIDDNRPETMRTDTSMVTYLFSGFDGSVHLQGHQQIPWQRMPITERSVQVLPAVLRKHPCSYNRLQRKLLSLLRRIAAA